MGVGAHAALRTVAAFVLTALATTLVATVVFVIAAALYDGKAEIRIGDLLFVGAFALPIVTAAGLIVGVPAHLILTGARSPAPAPRRVLLTGIAVGAIAGAVVIGFLMGGGAAWLAGLLVGAAAGATAGGLWWRLMLRPRDGGRPAPPVTADGI